MSTQTAITTGVNASRLSAVRVVGGLLPNDVVTAVLAGSIDGMKGSDYHLGSEKPREAAARAWTHLLAVYRRFRDDLTALPTDDPAVAVTRERWLSQVFADLGYGRVPSTPAGGLTAGEGASAKQYSVSHVWGSTPIHQLGWGVDLDRRSPGVAGAARAPHAMVQELLNRTDEYLWAIVTNGRTLRLLRDSTTLTGFAYVEFDLEAMFDGELFSEFALLYLLVHQSRVELEEGAAPNTCWLERWRTTAIGQGVRALTLLRDGVEDALETLGTGFLQHPANAVLRRSLGDGSLRLADIHAALLRTVYRLLFWAVAEDRDALHSPTAGPAERDRYQGYFSSARLRDLALRRHGSGHDDLWQSTTFVFDALGRSGGEPRLGLPGLGGLFTITAGDVLVESRLPNTALLSAVRSLSVVQPKGEPRRIVDFANLGAEELGSVYESLLELVPRYDPVSHAFSLETLAGNDRKTSGSYYTPSELVELTLDTALEPILDRAERQGRSPEERAAALVALKVCDPSVGSAHFLVAAARRIALRLAVARSGELDPTPSDYSDALHDVVGGCLYGVDLNPMSADLAKVSLWLTAMTPGKPLSFLDHHIKVGNGLLGTTPALLRDGVPDTAFAALIGDDKITATRWKKANKAERTNRGSEDLFGDSAVELDPVNARKVTAEVDQVLRAAASVDEVTFAAQRYATLGEDPETQRHRLAADAWCAAFLGEKTSTSVPITTAVVDNVSAGTADDMVLDHVRAIAARHRLFHWHLEFPEVFRIPDGGPVGEAYGWIGGFDAMLGNPPWETLEFSEKEFFATRDADIANAATTAIRKRMIGALNANNPTLFDEYRVESRRGQAEASLIKGSGRYPLTATGKINTYSLFAEHFTAAVAPSGRVGIITPTGLGTNDTTSAFIRSALDRKVLVSFFDFANHKNKLFDGLKGQSWFAITTMTGGQRIEDTDLAFDMASTAELADRRLRVRADEIKAVNPNSGTLPLFRTRRDADLVLNCYRNHPVLIVDGRENPWGLTFKQGLFNMSTDSELFATRHDLEEIGAAEDGWEWATASDRWAPLLEAKMVAIYNHRHGTYEGYDLKDGAGVRSLPSPTAEQMNSAGYEVRPRQWVLRQEVVKATPDTWDREWLFGWRDITNTTNSRTFIPSALPLTAVGHVFPLAFPLNPSDAPLLQAVWSSLVFDYISRQKLSGTHMTYGIVKQQPTPTPAAFDQHPAWTALSLAEFVRPRVLELTYTSSRMSAYACDVLSLPTGSSVGEAYSWLPERRAQLSAELDAAMFHVYGLSRRDAEHVIDSFNGLRKNEERDLGEFRTRRLVLSAYDAMSSAAKSGVPFDSPLSPPPGEGPRHPSRAHRPELRGSHD